MKTSLRIAIAVLGAAPLAACSTMEHTAPRPVTPAVAAAPAPAATPVTVVENTVTVTATVEKIDLAKRLVTLRGPDGKLTTIKVDETVRNLPQVKVGDEVVVAYYESLAYQLRRPGEAVPGVTAAEQTARAKPGQRPAGVGASVVTITATVTAIDTAAPSVTLKGPEGNEVTVPVRDPTRLQNVKVGDLVEITYSEALAVSVQPRAK